jgi:glycosyltransferase involved in cell wall biosynthesis
MNQLINQKGIRNVELLVAGDGDDIVKAKCLVQDLQLQHHVKFLGFIEDFEKNRVLSECHILILPTSYIEGMPVSILEAMLFGMFILASNKGGIIDLVGKENGTLINEHDTDSYVNRIIELVQNRQQLMDTSRYNHQYSVENYTASVVRKKLYKVFTKQAAQSEEFTAI